ncbi:KTSC domain-containing protein [uncultured Lacinutrix sp.]|uniref:KTSC domain-containing protein n=1 Tax=uncultured Lacinutrix sp. TaxID=574032 RepID=UPI002626A4C1|nr:KTSC domain-containing protein [uncultured Lacinutrix sp.]
MKRKSVNSSNLFSIGYDESFMILEIEFKEGGIYQYFNVPKSVYLGLWKASSHGKYFDRHIKKANYSQKKVR